jgi:hypothetical protein
MVEYRLPLFINILLTLYIKALNVIKTASYIYVFINPPYGQFRDYDAI